MPVLLREEKKRSRVVKEGEGRGRVKNEEKKGKSGM